MHEPASNGRGVSISIVVPMCNEEESLELLRRKLQTLQERLHSFYAVEYCLVDDGSTDRTGNCMASAVPAGATCVLVHHRVNRGVGAAIRSGLQAATGTIICTIDADCSYAPEDLATLIELVSSGQADVAVASPYHPKGGVIGVKPWRVLLSRQCSYLYRMMSPLQLYTYTSIFRAYRGTVARAIEFHNDGFVSAVEMLLSAARLGYSVREVPMVLKARERGYSKIRIARTIWAHLSLMGSILRKAGARALPGSSSSADRVPGESRRTRPVPLAARLGEDDRPIG